MSSRRNQHDAPATDRERFILENAVALAALDRSFVECDTCRAKPGTPLLCAGCLQNRSTLGKLERHNAKLVAAFESVLSILRDALVPDAEDNPEP